VIAPLVANRATNPHRSRSKWERMTDNNAPRFAGDALSQMGCEALGALLRAAPLADDPEELALSCLWTRAMPSHDSAEKWLNTAGNRF
jgi:hypothetical protein